MIQADILASSTLRFWLTLQQLKSHIPSMDIRLKPGIMDWNVEHLSLALMNLDKIKIVHILNKELLFHILKTEEIPAA